MNERPATERKTAEVWQTGYGCGHAVRSATNAELKAAGYTHIRIIGFLDVDGPCPACKEKRAATRTAQRRRLLAEQEGTT